MGTGLDEHLKNGKGESLARAKAALKGRLKQRMMQEVLEELQDTERVVEETMAEVGVNDDALHGAKEAIKAHLLDRVRQQAIGEIVAEVDGAHLEAHAEDDALAEAKVAFKKRLLDHVLHQAVEEVGAELDEAHESSEVHSQPLADAKDTVKARLRDQVVQQAIAEVGAEIDETQDAPAIDDTALAEAKGAFKARLREQAYQQAIDEVSSEAASDALLAEADLDALAPTKEAFKKQLLDQVLQQAIAEIDAEAEIPPDELAALAVEDFAARQGDAEPFADLAFAGDGAEAADAEVDFLSQEAESSTAYEPDAAADDASLVGAPFWEEEHAADSPTDPSVELALPKDGLEEGDESGFFLSDPSAPGNGSEGELDVELTDADVDDLLDFITDAPWPDVEEEPEAEAAEDSEAASNDEGVVYYVYGLFSGSEAIEDMLPIAGIDAQYSIYPLTHNSISALVSKVAADEYDTEALAVNQLDPVWRDEHTQSHEAIVQRFSGAGLFLPMAFATVYDREADIRDMLSDVSYLDALEKIEKRNQWQVRLYRNVEVLHQQVVEHSTAVQQLMADIKSKPKGGAQSIKKQMVSTIHEEEASMTDSCTKTVHERLFTHADDVELGALDGEGVRDKVELILDATYLVHQDDNEVFAADVEQLVAEYAELGFEFEVTGPEPPILFSRLQPAANA